MSYNLLYTKLVHEFKSHPILTRKELLSFFRQYEPQLNENTFTWRLFELKKRNLIGDIGRGIYTIKNKRIFEPALDSYITQINSLINSSQFKLSYCIMDTNWLCSISDGNLSKSIIVIEAEKNLLEEVFTLFVKNGIRELFLKPDKKTILRYVANAERPIILKPLLGRSPLQIFDNVYMPSLEKIIVDLWCDSYVYLGFEDNQLNYFYKSIIMNYTINFSKLMTYAKRRNQENEIKDQLLRVAGPELKTVIKKKKSLVNATL